MTTYNAIFVTNGASDVTIAGNVIRTTGLAKNSSAIQLGLSEGQDDFSVQKVNVSDNEVLTTWQFGAVRVRGQFSKKIVISDNVLTVERLDPPSFFVAVPVNAISAFGTRIAVTGNVVSHCAESQVAGLGPAIEAAGNQNVISANTIEMNPVTDTALQPAITVAGGYVSCTGNAIGLGENYLTPAIVLTIGSGYCTAVSNTCGTVPAVSDLGTLNEVAHNT